MEITALIKREVSKLHGLFYGSLSSEERELVNEAIKLGLARREWSGVAGLVGLSKVIVL